MIWVAHGMNAAPRSRESPSLNAPFLTFYPTYTRSGTLTFNSGVGGSNIE